MESCTGPRNLHVTLCLFLVVLLGPVTLLVKLLCVLPGVPSLPQNVLNGFLSDTDLKNNTACISTFRYLNIESKDIMRLISRYIQKGNPLDEGQDSPLAPVLPIHILRIRPSIADAPSWRWLCGCVP